MSAVRKLIRSWLRALCSSGVMEVGKARAQSSVTGLAVRVSVSMMDGTRVV